MYRFADGRAERNLDRLAEVIAADVQVEIEAGRIGNHKPDAFLLWGERKRQLENGERFVQTPDGSRGFIVKYDKPEWIVVTALSRARSEEAA